MPFSKTHPALARALAERDYAQPTPVQAAVLAKAGLDRLGLSDVVTEVLDPVSCLPAVGQGALGVECRDDDPHAASLLDELHDPETAIAVAAERGVLNQLDGDCKLPIAAHAARADDGRMVLRAMLARADGTELRIERRECSWPGDEREAEEFGRGVGGLLRG